jgi:hypothetical protein
MKLFTVRCHEHPGRLSPGCRECQTALDANFQGHRAGTCIQDLCAWCAAEAEAARPVPLRAAG